MAQWIGLPLLAFLYPLITAATQKTPFYDDPYILMRYGDHLAHGLGWNYNPGSPTNNAVTSPLYVLLIAAGTVIGGSPEIWSTCLYTAAWGLGAIVLARIFFVEGRRLGGWLACGLYSIAPLLANVRGMETSLYLLLILTAIWAFQRERWLVLGCLLALLALARSDGCLLAAALIGWLAVTRRRTALTVLGPFVAISALWAAASWMLTGSLLPSTLAAKLAQRDSGQWGGQWSFLKGLSANGIIGVELARLSDPRGVMPGLLLLAGDLVLIAAVFGTVLAFRRGGRALPLLSASAAIVLLEYGVVLRIPGTYVWHYGPWTLWVIAGVAVALEETARHGHRVTASLLLAGAVVALIAAAHVPDAWRSVRSNYRQVAEWIDRTATSPHPTVAAGEVGALGYYSHADLVDYLGLLDSRANDSVRRNDFTWWLSVKPDYWVTPNDWSVDAPTIALPQFQREYARAVTIGPDTVYRRIAP